jgi:glycosyltransferase involved in cell wall biosynthesis
MEHLSSMQLGNLIKRHFPNVLRIVDQHNIDHLLFAQNHNLEDAVNQERYRHIKQQESTMYTYADYFMACSSSDVKGLELLNQNRIKGVVVPNGTEARHINLKDKDFSKPNLLFCGSLDYTPNKNGLLWFHRSIWPELRAKIPNLKLTVIGKNGHDQDYAPLKHDEQIDFIGEVEDVAPYYQKSSMAIVPLLEGSGTRLKILEAMSFGVPVISTTIGADGIDYQNNRNIIIENEPSKICDCISQIVNDKDKLVRIGIHAKELIKEKYQWNSIIFRLVKQIDKIKNVGLYN